MPTSSISIDRTGRASLASALPYLVAAVLYFVICFSLSMLVRQLQKKIQIIR